MSLQGKANEKIDIDVNEQATGWLGFFRHKKASHPDLVIKLVFLYSCSLIN
jgi:hypothetical protein